MRDLAVVTGALLAGALAGISVASTLTNRPVRPFRDWIAAPLTGSAGLIARFDWQGRIVSAIDRAGWRWSARRATIMGGAVAGSLGLIGLAIGPPFAPLGFAAGACVCVMAITSAAERRRRSLEGELVPLLELFTLELSGGGSALSALGSVTVQVEGELAADLRRMLIASQVTGSASFENRLIAYSERLHISALGSLATILAASREFGTGTIQGVRALATDLRRGQRRELIARSRKALNHVLLPAAFGVLLPFLGILMFPALSVLQRSLR